MPEVREHQQVCSVGKEERPRAGAAVRMSALPPGDERRGSRELHSVTTQRQETAGFT